MRSFIRPSIVSSRGVSPESFSSFMTGRKESLGSSILNSAKNNIVNFNKTSIRPISTNIPDVINSISTNINTSTSNTNSNIINSTVNNFKVQGQNVFTDIEKKFRAALSSLINNIKRDYEQRIQNLEINRPSSILKKFLSLYQNAIDFITFFSNEKNFKRIQVSLKTLRKIFEDSFNVAKIIRQTIVRIVRQLSNLPTASGNAPDLNLDIRVPGGQANKRGLGGLGLAASRAGRIASAAELGIGAMELGSQMLSGRSKAEQIQEEKLRSTAKGQESQQVVPEDLLNGLERVISIFSNSIEDLIEFAKKRKDYDSQSSPSSPPPPSIDQNEPGSDGVSGVPMNIESLSDKDKDYLGRMIAAEVGTESPIETASVMSNILNRYRLINSGVVSPGTFNVQGKPGSKVTVSDVISARGQYSPYWNGSFQSTSSETGRRALQMAISAGGANPKEFERRLVQMGASPEAAKAITINTFFYNPRTAREVPFPGSKEYFIPGEERRHALGTPISLQNRMEEIIKIIFGSPLKTTPLTPNVNRPTTEIQGRQSQTSNVQPQRPDNSQSSTSSRPSSSIASASSSSPPSVTILPFPLSPESGGQSSPIVPPEPSRGNPDIASLDPSDHNKHLVGPWGLILGISLSA